MLRVRIKDSDTVFVYKGLTRLEAERESVPFHLRAFRWHGGECFPVSTEKKEFPIDRWVFEWVDGEKVEVIPTPATYPG